MHRGFLSLFSVVILAVAGCCGGMGGGSAGSSSSGSGSTGSSSGSGGGCSAPADCYPAADCRGYACAGNGACKYTVTPCYDVTCGGVGCQDDSTCVQPSTPGAGFVTKCVAQRCVAIPDGYAGSCSCSGNGPCVAVP